MRTQQQAAGLKAAAGLQQSKQVSIQIGFHPNWSSPCQGPFSLDKV